MSNLRQAAQQLIDRIDREGSTPLDWHEYTALRAALAEEALQRLTDVSQEIEAALAKPVFDCPRCGHCCPQIEQEPVAWMDRDGDVYPMPENKKWAPPHTMLYTAPPQRKPLSDEHPLMVFAKECVLGAYSEKELADAANRAIKYAHSFKGEA